MTGVEKYLRKAKRNQAEEWKIGKRIGSVKCESNLAFTRKNNIFVVT